MGNNHAYDAYEDIKRLVREISSYNELTRRVILISANSIPQYSRILADHRVLNLKMKLSNDELNRMKDELDDCKTENIEILSKKEQFQNLINSEDDKEIIMVDITFFEIMKLNLSNILNKTVTLIKRGNYMEIKLDNDEDTFEFKQKNNGLFKVFKSSQKDKLFKAYQNIKSIINEIYDEGNLTKDVFLIPSKSIPKLIKILTDLDALNPKRDLNIQKLEQMKRLFIDYKLETNIQIIYQYDQIKEFINSENNNEFIFASISFLKGMKINLEENFSKTVELNVDKKNIEIKFRNNENILIAKRKNNGLYKLIPDEEEENENEIVEYKNEDKEEKHNYNYANDISDIVSFLDCLKAITKLKNYFIENKSLLLSDDFKGIYSLFFYDFLTSSNLEDCIKTTLDKREGFSDHISLINTFYDEMHFELNKRGNKINEKKNEQNYQNETLEYLILNCRDDFAKNNKSIISDIFYFEKINILRCSKCQKILYRMENINKLIFNVEEVRNYKTSKCEGFDSLNILDCLHYFGHLKNNNANDCNCGNSNFETLSTKINSPPEILTIILHYKENFNDDIIFDVFPEKDSEDLCINIDFSIFNWGESNMTKKINAKYNLIGFCSYYNINERFCRPFYLDEDNKWYLHDTDGIKEVSLKDTEKGNPYFLFYQRMSN